MSTTKKYPNVFGDLEEKPTAVPRVSSVKRTEEINFGTFNDDNDEDEETSAQGEGQVFSSEDETAAETPTRKLHFDNDKPTRVWNFLLPGLSYEERQKVREARTISEVKRSGRNDLSVVERMALELDEAFNSADNTVVLTLLRPRVIDLGPKKLFKADFPDFDVGQELTANEILKAYAWMKTTLKFVATWCINRRGKILRFVWKTIARILPIKTEFCWRPCNYCTILRLSSVSTRPTRSPKSQHQPNHSRGRNQDLHQPNTNIPQ